MAEPQLYSRHANSGDVVFIHYCRPSTGEKTVATIYLSRSILRAHSSKELRTGSVSTDRLGELANQTTPGIVYGKSRMGKREMCMYCT